MKFIHVSDVHWGATPDSDKPWGADRAQAIKDSFLQVIETAKQDKIDLLLIAGDLFHRQPLLRELKEINYLFSTIPNTKVALIAGNHDCIRTNSAYLSFVWSSNVIFFKEAVMSSIYYDDINTQIYGLSYHQAEIMEGLYDQVKAQSDGRIHILLAHGGDAKHIPINRKALEASGFHYIALGHIHKPEIVIAHKATYSGSLEPLDKTETGKHGFIMGEITPQGQSLRFVPIAKVQYIPLLINVAASTTNLELFSRIQPEVNKRGKDNIYRFRIRGYRDPDMEFDIEGMKKLWNIIEVIDESEPEYNFDSLLHEHPSDMIGHYINTLRKPDMNPIERKALFYGINALLNTTDERR